MNVRRFIGIVIVAICVGSPIAEAFDRWDSTLQNGNDTEADFIIVALCVGMAIAMEPRIAATHIALPSARSDNRLLCVPVTTPLMIALVPVPTVSPPLPLRV